MRVPNNFQSNISRPWSGVSSAGNRRLGENNAIMKKKEKKTSERAAMKTKFTDVPLREKKKKSFEVVRLL